MQIGRATQKDVAEQAGVSQGTVSQWLNGNRRAIAAETAARIEAAIEALGYRPNRAAQALRTAQRPVIACVVPDLANPFYPALVAGVQGPAGIADCDVVAVNTGGGREAEEAVLRAAAQGRYDGLVGVFFTLRHRDFLPLLRAGVAVARIEARRKAGGEAPLDDVFVDNRSAAREATAMLLGLGHRAIAMVAGTGGPEAERVEGYRAAMAAAGAPARLAQATSFTEPGGREATARLLATGEPLTAIVAANDLMAIGAMRELARQGRAVPGDVSVVGFDDIQAAGLVTPGLSSVALDQDALGARAAELLLERLGGGHAGPGRVVEMPFRLVRRGSVAPPGGAGAGGAEAAARIQTVEEDRT